jgi:hypothetical protein
MITFPILLDQWRHEGIDSSYLLHNAFGADIVSEKEDV